MLNDLGLYKTDPFNTLAIEINEPLQEALKHFVGFQAAASYSQGEHTSFNPNRNLVFWSSKSSVPAMHGLVAMAAIHEARLRGQRESTLCMHHMGESMRLLREKLVDISRNFSEIILTICGLACINVSVCRVTQELWLMLWVLMDYRNSEKPTNNQKFIFER